MQINSVIDCCNKNYNAKAERFLRAVKEKQQLNYSGNSFWLIADFYQQYWKPEERRILFTVLKGGNKSLPSVVYLSKLSSKTKRKDIFT